MSKWVKVNGRAMINMENVLFVDENKAKRSLEFWFGHMTKSITFKTEEEMSAAFDKIWALMDEEGE